MKRGFDFERAQRGEVERESDEPMKEMSDDEKKMHAVRSPACAVRKRGQQEAARNTS